GTVKKDDPSLDCRIRGGNNPYRIIVDSRLHIPLRAKVLRYHDNRTIIATTARSGRQKAASLEKMGHRVLVIKDRDGRVDLKSLMKELGRLDITSVMIEGGSSISASSLAGKIVDRVMFFIAPKIIGGIDSIPSVGGPSPALLKNALMLKDMSISVFGDDVLIEGYPSY
ncbi:MAG: dihydrofolate reductase family protein, partial [Deltaproteobacteria bacterium]|nr:dihydrofolate reductase family protein [Deltaproteobacteria bacterium]